MFCSPHYTHCPCSVLKRTGGPDPLRPARRNIYHVRYKMSGNQLINSSVYFFYYSMEHQYTCFCKLQILHPNIRRQLKQDRFLSSMKDATQVIVRIERLNNLTCIGNRRGRPPPRAPSSTELNIAQYSGQQLIKAQISTSSTLLESYPGFISLPLQSSLTVLSSLVS